MCDKAKIVKQWQTLGVQTSTAKFLQLFKMSEIFYNNYFGKNTMKKERNKNMTKEILQLVNGGQS